MVSGGCISEALIFRDVRNDVYVYGIGKVDVDGCIPCMGKLWCDPCEFELMNEAG